ncbi:ABC transporter permease [Clostridium sp. SHJSY1]|uniref:ABC transporter permease n=1 Tax=Clostridium sp. SHJSY1 TaxID=2942483 RepID=UPI002875660A|nr:ABC transporter permease [Clostridium sp. SHJSY1]MDS0525961.1 ABC transporter permease [Clostridium sp. SHJSY1]
MNFFIILKSNLKRILKIKTFVIISFVLPLAISLILGTIYDNTDDVSGEIVVINSDSGTLATDVIEELQKTNEIKVYTKEDGLEKVKKKSMPVCYEIPENFSELIKKGEKPEVIAHKYESIMASGDFEFNLNSVINNIILKNTLQINGVDSGVVDENITKANIEVIGNEKASMSDTIILNVIVSFIFFGAITIAEELFALKKQNILERSFSTANKPWKILLGILGAMFIFLVVVYSSTFLIESKVRMSVMLDKWPIVVLNMIFLVLVSLSLGILAARICKNENTISIVVQMISWITCFIGGSFAPLEFLPETVQHFSRFTPQYWALESINTGNYSLAFIVGLFAVVLFTAGTFKTRKFI